MSRWLRVLIIFFIFYALIFMLPHGIHAQDAGSFQPGEDAAGPKQFLNLILRIINISVGIAFMAMTVLFVVAGIKFITSEGDQKKIASARMTITWAVLGIFFMALGWLILLLIQHFTGVNVTNFCIGFNGLDYFKCQ